MSIEAKNLAIAMNNLDLSAEKSKDDKVYYEGLRQYESIKLKITFILPRGLKKVPDYLDDNGKKVYEKLFKDLIAKEIKGGK